MLRLYKYIFYRFYRWNRYLSMFDSFWWDSMQAMSSTLGIVILQMIWVVELIEWMLGRRFGEDLARLPNPILTASIVALIICSIVMYLFGGEAGYKKIIEEYEKKGETLGQKIVKGSLIWLFLLGSLGIILFS